MIVCSDSAKQPDSETEEPPTKKRKTKKTKQKSPVKKNKKPGKTPTRTQPKRK